LLQCPQETLVERVLKTDAVERYALFVFAVARFLDKFIEEVVRAAVGGDYCHLPAPCDARQGDGIEHLRILVQREFVQDARAALAGLCIGIGAHRMRHGAVSKGHFKGCDGARFVYLINPLADFGGGNV